MEMLFWRLSRSSHRGSSQRVNSIHPNVLEPIRPTILFQQEIIAFFEISRFTTFAFGGVGAVEVGDMVIANVAEPAEVSISLLQYL